MPLDLSQIAAQVENMAAQMKTDEKSRAEHLEYALDTLRAQESNLDALRAKIQRSKTTWLVADLMESLSQSYEPPPCPSDFTVIAADGSHIDVDREQPVACYLINIGTAVLRYGSAPDALLSSSPALYTGEEHMAIHDPASANRQELEGALLGVKRTVCEAEALAELAQNLSPDHPDLALLDGSLILWGLSGREIEDYVRAELLDRGFLKALDRIRDAGQKRRLALASYISFPRSTDVVNTLRVALCPYEPVDCDVRCSPKERPVGERPCDAVAGVLDRDLFERLLGPGDRSATFVSPSSIVEKHYGHHQVQFFYLRVEDEIARVEVPQWVGENRELLDLAHTLIVDQCRRGYGYPVALTEAHEKAVVSEADRQQFWRLVYGALAENRLPDRGSAKSRSKRIR
jgi:hypothetical protein